MRITPAKSSSVIVLVGHLNPRIFLPTWFSKNGVIGQEEGENAEIELVHRDLVKFKLDWLTVVVEHGRFIVELDQPPDIRLFDFAQKTFTELLVHTPIWAMGINKHIEFDAGSAEKRDKIGFTLAPPQAWGEWSESILKGSDSNHGGMMSLSMRQTDTDDRPDGYIQAKVEPSKLITNGVYVEVNDHYSLPQGEDIEGCAEIMEIMARNFDSSIARSEMIVDQVMGIVK